MEQLDIFLPDGIGPFFKDYSKRQVNWSKIPFNSISVDQAAGRQRFDRIAADMELFACRLSRIGYKSVFLDGVAHLPPDPRYMETISRQIVQYGEECRRLFAILIRHELAVYLTMDVLLFTPPLKEDIDGSLEILGQYRIFTVFLLTSQELFSWPGSFFKGQLTPSALPYHNVYRVMRTSPVMG